MTRFLQLHVICPGPGFASFTCSSEDCNHGSPGQTLNQQDSTVLWSQGHAFARLYEQVLFSYHERRHVLEAKAGDRLQFYGVGDKQNEWLEIHPPEIKKATALCLGVCPFSFGSVTRTSTHLSMCSHARPIVTIQNDPPTRAQGFSEDGPSGHLAAP